MDGYGHMTLDDASEIAATLKAKKAVWFGFAPNRITTLSLLIAPPSPILGQLPYSGQPYGRFGVGIVYHAFAHFNLGGDKPLYESYVGEKLNLDEADAIGLTRLLNAIREALVA